MNKKQLEQLLKNNEILVKKKYGQNFLLDDNVVKNIANYLDGEQIKNVIEIGPGLGFLTKELSKRANKVVAFEIDQDMVDYLNTQDFHNVMVKHQDILKADLDKTIKEEFNNEDVAIVANLPYYITTPILVKLLSYSSNFKYMVVMMQKEVAQRICGKPSTKDYNALSVLIQYYTNAKIIFNVSPSSFYPEPNVDSSVVFIEKKDKILDVLSEKSFLVFIKSLFAQRRKTLMNNLTTTLKIPKDIIIKSLEKNNFSLSIRSEELSIGEIVNLFNDIYTIYKF